MTQHEPMPLDYAEGALRPRRRVGRLIELLIVLGIIAVLVALLLPAVSRHEPGASSVRCLVNLRTVGQYMQRYVANQGAYPDRVETLFAFVQYASPPSVSVGRLFCCPKSFTTSAVGATTQAVRADFAVGPKTSYTYLADGMPPQTMSDVVVMIETAGTHNGMHAALFADGHAQLLRAAAANQVLKQGVAGVRPVVWPPRVAAATRPAR